MKLDISSDDSSDYEKKTIDELNMILGQGSQPKREKTIRAFRGISALGLIPQPADRPNRRYFITVALPHKEKVKLNDRTDEYRLLKTTEQYLYLKRVEHLMNHISDDFLIVFEHCFSGDLHLHITCSYRGIAKDLSLEFRRFFLIKPSNNNAILIKEIYDEEHLRNYLLEKDQKKYQTSLFPKIEKKPIEDFN